MSEPSEAVEKVAPAWKGRWPEQYSFRIVQVVETFCAKWAYLQAIIIRLSGRTACSPSFSTVSSGCDTESSSAFFLTQLFIEPFTTLWH